MAIEPKTNKRTQDSLKAIEKAVFDLLEEKQFESVTARDIYIKAGVNKMTFYKYHNNKYDALAKAFTARLNDEFIAAFTEPEALYEQGDYIEITYRGLMFVVDFIERYRIQFSHLVSSSGDLPRDVVFSAFFANYRPFFLTLIGEDATGEKDYLLHFAFGAFRSIYDCQMQQMAKNPDGPFQREDAERACRTIAKSLSEVIRAFRGDLNTQK